MDIAPAVMAGAIPCPRWTQKRFAQHPERGLDDRAYGDAFERREFATDGIVHTAPPRRLLGRRPTRVAVGRIRERAARAAHSDQKPEQDRAAENRPRILRGLIAKVEALDRKSTRLNSSHRT